jgi:hypothetical protein
MKYANHVERSSHQPYCCGLDNIIGRFDRQNERDKVVDWDLS